MVVEDHTELVLLLASALRAAGFEADTYATGEAALQQLDEGEPDAAIVDLMLPDMMGSELVLELSARGVPVVAVSGVFRGKRYQREATEEHGAAAFLEKPFSTQALVETLRELTGLDGPAVPAHAAGARTSSELDTPVGSEEDVIPEPLRTARHRRMGIVEDLIPVSGPSTRGSPETAILDPALPATRLAPPPPSRSRDPSTTPGCGSLGEVTVPRLLVAYHQARTTGALHLTRGKVKKVIFIREGQPTFAASNLASERLLTFAARSGRLSDSDAEAAYRLAQETGRRVGELLIELGVLDRAGLADLVRDQVRSMLWDCFAWREGTFRIDTETARNEPLRLRLPLQDLVLEGTRRAVPPELLETELADDLLLAPEPAPAIPVEALPLTADEAWLLSQIDGTKTVADLLTLSELPPDHARALLRATRQLRTAAPRRLGPPATDRIGFLV